VLQGKELEQGGAYCRGTRSSREEQGGAERRVLQGIRGRSLSRGSRAEQGGACCRGRRSGRLEQQGKELRQGGTAGEGGARARMAAELEQMSKI
jgi:hypothetical protein